MSIKQNIRKVKKAIANNGSIGLWANGRVAEVCTFGSGRGWVCRLENDCAPIELTAEERVTLTMMAMEMLNDGIEYDTSENNNEWLVHRFRRKMGLLKHSPFAPDSDPNYTFSQLKLGDSRVVVFTHRFRRPNLKSAKQYVESTLLADYSIFE